MKRSIEASTTIRAPQPRVSDVLLDDPGAAFTDRATPDERRSRCFGVDLSVELRAGARIDQRVAVQLGVVRFTDTGVAVPLAWQATGRRRLLPTFDGELVADHAGAGTSLRLCGRYAVPLGMVGRFGDGVVGRRVARGSLSALLERIAGRLDAEVARRLQSVPWHPAPYPIDLRDLEPPETYLG